jgi:hypothetical protein
MTDSNKQSSGQSVRSDSKQTAVIGRTVVSASGAKLKVTELRLSESARRSLSMQVAKIGAAR